MRRSPARWQARHSGHLHSVFTNTGSDRVVAGALPDEAPVVHLEENWAAQKIALSDDEVDMIAEQVRGPGSV